MNILNKILFYTGILMLSIFANAEAALIDRGNGLIYDPDLNITWLADGNYAMTSGYDADGKMTWSEALTWAQQLNYAGFTNWRLPTTLDPDPSCVELESIYGPYDYYCSGSEMGHLFYSELAGVPLIPTNSAAFGPDLALFSNMKRANYWSATEAAAGAAFPGCTSNCVWDFDIKNGVQTAYPRTYRFFALAVHPGDIGGGGLDSDGDGVLDVNDNCTLVSNPSQTDTDSDGYGNTCDGDFDNNGLVDGLDLATFKSLYLTENPLGDLNDDVFGFVDSLDLSVFRNLFQQPPGPSGLAP